MEVWSKLSPTVLIVATQHWFPTARLAVALANAGCVVEAVCPDSHPVCATSAVQRLHAYKGLAPVRSLTKAIESAKPDLIVPGDDLSTHYLHLLYRRALESGTAGAPICAVIERSLGSPASFSVVESRDAFMQQAEEEGIRVPKTRAIPNLGALRQWIAEFGYPAVLKADGTSGGYGVRIVHTVEKAERAFRALQAPPLLARAVKRALINRDGSLIWPSLLRRRSAVSVQTFVEGHDATSTVACWQGNVLGALHFQVINKRYASGPATVMRWIDNACMSESVAKMVRRLNLSGVHGFDFILHAQSSDAYLIEINPRTTQVGHLTLGMGRDLPAALYAAVTDTPIQPARKLTDNDTIALFPQEWMRDPNSPFLQSAYHDVPSGEPELLRSCIRSGQKQNALDTQQRFDQAFARVPRI